MNRAAEWVIKLLDIRRRRFHRVFNTPDGKQVLAYLKRKLTPTGTPFAKDSHEMARRVGHQEAFQIIIQMTNMTDDQIAQLKEQNNG